MKSRRQILLTVARPLLVMAALASAGILNAQTPAPSAPAASVQPTPQASPQAASSQPTAQPHGRATTAKPAGVPPLKAAPVAKGPTKPTWAEISPMQREVLAPLGTAWDSVSEAQKRKWLALAQNFPKLAPAEQAKLRSRMTEWVAMSPQQRSQARLNFGESQKLGFDDKRAKWEAYQALPPEEKTKLAGAAAAAKTPPTAAAVKPVAPEKLATVPKTGRPKADVKTPRIAAAPNQVDHNTLLPQPGNTPASASPTN